MELHVTLFERSNGGTRPTSEGLEFLDAARRIVDEVDGLSARLNRPGHGHSSRLSIGVHVSLSAGNLRATLIEHHRRHPETATTFVDGSLEQLASRLTRSTLDIAFVADREGKWSGKSLSVWSERAVVALPESHQLAARDILYWCDLKGQQILLPQSGPGAEFMNLLAEKIGHSETLGVHRHEVSLDRLLTFVGAGFGLLLALEGATGGSYPGVVFRELHGENGPARVGFDAIWQADNRNPALHRFVDMLKERYPDFSADAPTS